MRNRVIALTCALLVSSLAFAQNNPTGSMANMMDSKAFDDSFGKLPTNITSDSLTFNAKDRVFSYVGNVQVTQGDMRLTSKTLEGTYSEKNELLKLVAKGDVFISKQDIQATGQIASYDAVAAIVTLTENPQLQQKESILRADHHLLQRRQRWPHQRRHRKQPRHPRPARGPCRRRRSRRQLRRRRLRRRGRVSRVLACAPGTGQYT